MLPYMWGSQAKCYCGTTAVMTNGMTVFTVGGGPIQILEIFSVCITANGATASTMQWNLTPTVGSAKTLSAASASLANLEAGSTVTLNPTSLATAPTIVSAEAGGVSICANVSNRIIIPDGVISLVIGVGSTTGTWKHYIRYEPLAPDAMINGN